MRDDRHEDPDRPEAESPPRPTFMETLTGTPETPTDDGPSSGIVVLEGGVIPLAPGESPDLGSLPLTMRCVRSGPISPYRPPGTTGRRFASSLDLTDGAARIAAYRAIAGEDFRAEDVLGEWFQIVDWLTVDASKLDPLTGKPSNFIRTVLIAEDGTRISCGSDWVVASLQALEGMMGRAPWQPALRLAIKAGRSASKRTFYTLDIS